MSVQKENTVLVVLFSIDGVLLVMNLVFAIYISIWYFCRLRVKGAFILLFYIFVDITTVARIGEVFFTIRNLWVHREDPDFYELLENGPYIEIFRSLAYLSFFGLGLVVVSTMFQIGISLQVLSQEINSLSARRR